MKTIQPNLVTTDELLKRLGKLAKLLKKLEFQLLPYHRDTPTDTTMQKLCDEAIAICDIITKIEAS